MPTDPASAASLVASTVAIAAFVQGSLGFGFGIVCLLVLPFALDPKTAHVLVSLAGVPSLAMVAYATREGANWRLIIGAVAAAGVCLPIGLYLFSESSDDALIRGTGLVILVLMVLELRAANRTHAGEPPAWTAWIAGALSGFLAGAVSIGGPPIVAYAMRTGWTAIKAKAFITRFLLLVASYKAASLIAMGLVTMPIAVGVGWSAAIAVAATAVGAHLTRNLETARYRKIVAAVLIAISLWWLVP